VGVNEWGARPSKFIDRRVMNRANTGAAQGAEPGPAARSTKGGRAFAREVIRKFNRVDNQFGENSRDNHVGANTVASTIIGSKRTIGGLNWSNRLRLMVIGVRIAALWREQMREGLEDGGRLLLL